MNNEEGQEAPAAARLREMLAQCTPCEWGYNPAHAPVALVLLAPAGTVLHANAAAARLLADGDEPGELVGKRLSGFGPQVLARMRALEPGASMAVGVRCAGERIASVLAACCDAEPGASVPPGSCWLHLMVGATRTVAGTVTPLPPRSAGALSRAAVREQSSVPRTDAR